MSTAILKITHLTSVHKLVVPLSIKWVDLEEQIHNIFSIPSDTPFLLRYRDEDGDLITLNSDLEFEQVLCAGARVKFLLTLPQDEVDQPDNDWDVSSTSSFDTISEEPVFVQQENEKDEEDAVYFVDMDTEDGNPKLQGGSAKTKDNQKEKEVEGEIPSSRSVDFEIFHDFPNSLLQEQQELPEEHSRGMHHVKMVETSSAAASEQQSIIQERQSGQQDERDHSTIEGLSTKVEKIIQQCYKVLGDDPEMLNKVNSIMDHVLENTPMYIEFVLNMLNSVKNQNQNTDFGSSDEASSSQQDHIDNPPNMPGSFPNNTPLFQFRSAGGGYCRNISSPHILPSVINRHSNVDDLHMFPPPPPPPLNVLPPPPPPPPPASRVSVNQLYGAPPQPLNPPFTLSHTTLLPFPGSFPLTDNDLDSSASDNYSTKLAELHDMGFTNNEQNLSLLRKHNGDIEAVVENIISQRENNSNSGSNSYPVRIRYRNLHRSPGGSGSRSLSTRTHFRNFRNSGNAYNCMLADDSAMLSD